MLPESNPNIELSIVVPSHNDAVCLELTLQSLQRQSLPAELFEVVVVRDGGDASQYEGILDAGKGLNLRYIELAEQRGRAGARNEGVRHANGAVLLFLDADCYTTPELAERHLRHHREPSAPAVLIGRRDESSMEHLHAALAGEPAMPVPRSRPDGGGDLRFPAGGPESSDWLPAGWMFCYTHNVSVRRSVFDAVGGFTEDFGLRWGLEDMELFYRVHVHLGLLEHNFAYDDAALVYHLPHHRVKTNNWNDFIDNLAVISQKTPIVDWEFVGPLELERAAERVVRYRKAMNDCTQRGLCRIGPAVQALSPGLPGPQVLWIGTGSAEAELPPQAWTFDYSKPVSPTNYHMVGMHPLSTEPDSIDAVVSVDFWRYLVWDDLCQAVNMAGLAAREVHLVCTDAQLANAFQPDPASLGYLSRVMSSAFDTSLTEVDGLGTVLRLRPRRTTLRLRPHSYATP
jgi:glycosyltransferase involved in cell wall biosynthesis